MILNIEERDEKLHFLWKDHSYEIGFCAHCGGEWILICDCGCRGTSCNGGGCPGLLDADTEWQKFARYLWRIRKEDEEKHQEFVKELDRND